MKKILISIITLSMISCVTPTINQVELYGNVENITYYDNHNHIKVWCETKGKYYKVITDKTYQIGDVIKIK